MGRWGGTRQVEHVEVGLLYGIETGTVEHFEPAAGPGAEWMPGIGHAFPEAVWPPVRGAFGHSPPAKKVAVVACMDARLEGDVRQSIARIKASPFIPRKDSVRGFVYEVETGRLREVD